jgi:alanine racemase
MLLDVVKKLLRKSYKPLNIIEISKKRLIDNYNHLSSLNDKIKIAPVLKSNAYGHGIVETASVLDKLDPVFFCVDSLFEAYELLKSKIKTPILIMGYVNAENLSVKKLPFSYAVNDLVQFRNILKYQPEAKIHLFIDTGMNREGVRADELENFLKELTEKEKNNIEGAMSHLALAEDPNNFDTKKQIKNFKKAIILFKKYSIFPKWVHFGNSSGLLNNKKLKLSSFSNVARTGLILYESVLQLKTHIIQIKNIKKGEKVGYDFTYQVKIDGLMAVLPIGYNDGVDRRLSNIGVVKIKDQYCPIIGRVSMNLMVINIDSIKNIQVGSEVIIYSNNNDDKNSINNSAKKIGIIPYELLIHLDKSIKRKII